MVTKYGVELDAFCQQIGERRFKNLLDASPNAVVVDVVAEQQYEVELRTCTAIGPHFSDDAAQAWRHVAAVADDTENDWFLGRAGRRDERQRQYRQAGSEPQGSTERSEQTHAAII